MSDRNDFVTIYLHLGGESAGSPQRNVSLMVTGSLVVLSTGLSSLDPSSLLSARMIYRPSTDTKNYSAISCSISPVVNTYVQRDMISPPPDDAKYYPSNSQLARPYETAPVLPVIVKNITAEDAMTWFNPEDCVYSLSADSVDRISLYFIDMFEEKELQWSGGFMNNRGNIYLRQIFQEGNITFTTIDNVFESMATSMSAIIRTHGIEASSGQLKMMWYNSTCIRIKWPWITSPAVLIWLTMSFLVDIGIESRGIESDRLWKSSVLATSFRKWTTG
ncbi:hypothetical protein T440DRAFT_533726 [Plenodomus tracheiphilus IPT5]|uniref:Uncharacterized protein n=1 Tax=Plenodomus tracheiphilus IPT5 TaxID=1408161 RepID=A0A6A7B219_9PLEO|nr:hypothetical protein T440DRAFT_533726 [Plenodomus tracheiphilus IPT5]